MAKRITDLTELGDGNDLANYFAEIDRSDLGETMKIALKTLLRGLIDNAGNVVAKGNNGTVLVDEIKRLTPSVTDKVALPTIEGCEKIYFDAADLGLNPATCTVKNIAQKLALKQAFMKAVSTSQMEGLDLPTQKGMLIIAWRVCDYGTFWDIRFIEQQRDTTSNSLKGFACEYYGHIEGDNVYWQRDGIVISGEFKRVSGEWQCKYQGRPYSVEKVVNVLKITHNLGTSAYLCSIFLKDGAAVLPCTYGVFDDYFTIMIEDGFNDIENIFVRFKIELIGSLITP